MALALAGAAALFFVWGPLPAVCLMLAASVGTQAYSSHGFRRRVARLRTLAHLDELTRLGNQRSMWDTLDRLVAQPPGGKLAIVMADIDHFKRVNDSYGHPVGDAILRSISHAVRQSCRTTDLCFRYGGEEMVILLPGQDEDTAWVVAERLRREVAGRELGLPAVTLSCGIGELSGTMTPGQLLDRADRALRKAKLGGRNRVVAASDLRGDDPDAGGKVGAARRAALELASAALLARDSATADHSDGVVVLCEALAEHLGLSGTEREQLLLAARLHDIGKVAVPQEILRKPGPLTQDEMEVMRTHATAGERILRSVPELAAIATIVRHAHERYDGNGYPDGLAGERIPRASRIIFCADAFHAIRSNRPYRKGRSATAAIAEICRNSGTQFDPVVAEALGAVSQATRKRVILRAPAGSRRLAALLMTLCLGGTGTAMGATGLLGSLAGLVGGDRGSAHRAAVLDAAGCALPGSCGIRIADLGSLGNLFRDPVQSASEGHRGGGLAVDLDHAAGRTALADDPSDFGNPDRPHQGDPAIQVEQAGPGTGQTAPAGAGRALGGDGAGGEGAVGQRVLPGVPDSSPDAGDPDLPEAPGAPPAPQAPEPGPPPEPPQLPSAPEPEPPPEPPTLPEPPAAPSEPSAGSPQVAPPSSGPGSGAVQRAGRRTDRIRGRLDRVTQRAAGLGS